MTTKIPSRKDALATISAGDERSPCEEDLARAALLAHDLAEQIENSRPFTSHRDKCNYMAAKLGECSCGYDAYRMGMAAVMRRYLAATAAEVTP